MAENWHILGLSINHAKSHRVNRPDAESIAADYEPAAERPVIMVQLVIMGIERKLTASTFGPNMALCTGLQLIIQLHHL